jgi:hypothetical protein
MNTKSTLIALLLACFTFTIACDSEDDKENTGDTAIAGESAGGEAQGGEAQGGEAEGGEAEGGEAEGGEAEGGEAEGGEAEGGEAEGGEAEGGEAEGGEAEGGEAEGGEAEGGEAEGGESSNDSVDSLLEEMNFLYETLSSSQATYCESCPEDGYCAEGEEDEPYTLEEAECVIENLTEEELAQFISGLACIREVAEEFAACTAMVNTCDDAYFNCLAVFANEESCTNLTLEELEASEVNVDVLCHGAFECADGSDTFDGASVCDGVEDCPDGSDEANCEG